MSDLAIHRDLLESPYSFATFFASPTPDGLVFYVSRSEYWEKSVGDPLFCALAVVSIPDITGMLASPNKHDIRLELSLSQKSHQKGPNFF